jgi:hypothetical protein
MEWLDHSHSNHQFVRILNVQSPSENRNVVGFQIQSYASTGHLYSLLWGQLCERVTVTDVCRLYNFYEHVITQQLILD